jgi:hypothetical protein
MLSLFVVKGLPQQYFRIPGMMMGKQIETFLRQVVLGQKSADFK